MLCKRCKKNEAAEGKKNCPACAEYMRNYMKQMRAKKKSGISSDLYVPLGRKYKTPNIYDKKPKEPMILNDNPEYSFDVSEDSGTIFDKKHVYDPEKKTLVNVNKKDVNKTDVNKNNVNKILEINTLTPEDFRYFYFRISGKVFRENKNKCVKELIKILEAELKNA